MDERVTVEALRSFASIARELAARPARAATSARIAQLAVKVTGCDAATVSRLVHKRLVIEASTDVELGAAVQSIAMNTKRSISRQACLERAAILCNDLETEPSWAEPVRLSSTDTPLRAVLALPLQLEDQNLGAVSLYSITPDYFAPGLCDLAQVYADHAAIALSLVSERERVDHLHIALESNREIGAAVGIVMARSALDSQAAFDLLRLVSQHTNRRICDVASDVVTTRDIATLPSSALLKSPAPAADQLTDSDARWFEVSDYQVNPAPAVLH